MAIIQPLYYPGGKYKPGDDRKILAALAGFEYNGTKTVGVIGSPNLTTATGLMKVDASGSTGTFTVQPGLCVIADAATQVAATPGVYLAGIDSGALTLTTSNLVALPGSGTRTDLVYAQIDETPYTISSASRTGTTVTLTTSAAHGFKIGDTVVVTGIDEVFNGTYTAISPTSSTTITYSTSSTGTISSTTYYATATPFDTQDTTAGSGTGIPITITNRAFAQSGTTANGIATITVGVNLSTAGAGATALLSVGDRVRISGLSSVFDGDHVVTGVTAGATSTFTYTRSWTGTAVTALGSAASQPSANAQVRVPFAIRMASGTTTMPSVTGIPLANATINTAGTFTAVVDRRLFVGASGGIHYFDSTAATYTDYYNSAKLAEGRLSYDVSANKLYYSDGSLLLEVNNSTHNHDTIYYPAAQSSSGVLSQPSSYSTSGGYLDIVTGTSFDDATGSTFLDQYSGSPVAVAASVTCIAACFILVDFSALINNASSTAVGQVDVQLSGATTTSAFTVGTSGSNSKVATDGTAMTTGDWIYHSYAAYGTASVTHHRSKLYKVNAGTTTFTLRGKINLSAQSVTVDALSLRVIPLYNA